MDPDTAAASETEAIKPKSLFNRLWGTIFSPGETFKEVGLAPRVFVPIIALFLASMVYAYFMARHLDVSSLINAQQMNQAAAQGGLPQARLELIIAIVLAVFIPVFSVIAALIVAGIGKLISVFVGAENTFKPLFSVTLYAMTALTIIRAALIIVLFFVKGPGQVSMQHMNSIIASNLGAIIGSLFGEDALPSFLMKLLEYVDAFAIWSIALLSIGYASVSRRLKAGTVAIWFSVLYAIMAILGATFGSMFAPK